MFITSSSVNPRLRLATEAYRLASSIVFPHVHVWLLFSGLCQTVEVASDGAP